MIGNSKYLHYDYLVLVYALLLCVVKFILYPYTQTIDADAVSRTLISYRWSEEPHFIWDSVWLPLHFYLNGILISITGFIEDTPRILNIILSSLTLIPLYYFLKNEFTRTGALFGVVVFSLSSVVFRNSFQALSSTPCLFFMAIGLYLFSKALRNDSLWSYIMAGFSMTIAAGFRYEAWIIIAAFTLIGILRKRLKGTLTFWFTAIILPLAWMIIGQVCHGDFLYGIHGPQEWLDARVERNLNLSNSEVLKRLMFLPLSWFLILSPIVSWLIIVVFSKVTSKGLLNRSQWVWMLPLLILGILFMFKIQEGSLFMQHRFTAPIVFFSIPFVSMTLEVWASKKVKLLMWIFPVLMIPQHLLIQNQNWTNWSPLRSKEMITIIEEVQLYTSKELKFLPQLENQNVLDIYENIDEQISDTDGLILDFIGWTETYFLALKYPEKSPFIFPTDDLVFPKENFAWYINTFPKGKLFIHCVSDHKKYIQLFTNRLKVISDGNLQLDIDLISNKEGILLFEYKAVDVEFGVKEELEPFSCLELGSVEYYKSQILFSHRMKQEAENVAK